MAKRTFLVNVNQGGNAELTPSLKGDGVFCVLIMAEEASGCCKVFM